jgi:hypothetical protein
MRKFFCILAIMTLLVIPAFAEWRLDLGALAPRGMGAMAGGATPLSSDLGSQIADWPFIPLPEAGLYYEADLGDIKLGLGARAFTAILATIVWPNAFVELELGRVAIEAQVGGGAFGFLTVVATTGGFGKVFIPDISVWYKLGKNQNFRLGAGAIGLYMPELLGDGLPFLFYIGGKASIPL